MNPKRNCIPYLFCLGVLLSFSLIQSVQAQYDDVRCKCICPVLREFVNETVHPQKINRKLYIGNVAQEQCNCDFVVLPHLDAKFQDRAKDICPRCECKYESRNTTMIRNVVIIIIGIISFLTIYMAFLSILDPWIHKSKFCTSKLENILVFFVSS